jgi:hypothetical protein
MSAIAGTRGDAAIQSETLVATALRYGRSCLAERAEQSYGSVQRITAAPAVAPVLARSDLKE